MEGWGLFSLLPSAGRQGPIPSRFRFRERWSPGWTLPPRLPPAVPGSRGDGRPLTRGAEAARRGLDHWAAEGAARPAGPAPPGPLICLYYPRETKLPGTDAPAPSFLRKAHHTLTFRAAGPHPQTRRAPSRPPNASTQRPQNKCTPASFCRPDLTQKLGVGWGSWLRAV